MFLTENYIRQTSSTEGGPLFISSTTKKSFEDFLSNYQTMSTQPQAHSQPFVFVDTNEIKLVTSLVDELDTAEDSIFAVSMAEDGWMELLALHES